MNTRNSTRPLGLLLLILSFSLLASAQERKAFSLDAMHDPSLGRAFAVPRTWWLTDNTALLVETRKDLHDRVLERFDPTTGHREPAYDVARARQNFAKIFSGPDGPTLPPLPASFSDDGQRGFYLINGDIVVLTLSTAAIARVTDTPEEEHSVNFSPDGTKLAYVRNNDLYVYDLSTNTETRLTRDGSDTILNGTLSWVYWEEIFGRRDVGYWWSNDSKSIAFLRTDDHNVSIQHYVDISPWTPTVTTQRYPKVGEPNPEVRVGFVNVRSASTVWAGIDSSAYEYVMRVDWFPDSRQVCIRTLNRLQTDLSFWFVDPAKGAARRIMEDTNKGWINMSDDLTFVENGKEFIISSERDGYAHLYRFSLDGNLVNQITKGPWALATSSPVFWIRRAIAGVDEKHGWIYFTAQEHSSLERHLYRIHVDGTNMERLTREEGTHSISMSPNARWYFDRYSNLSTPPSLTLYESPGTSKMVLATPDLGGFKDYGAQFGELLWIPARDGFKLPAWLLKPAHLEPGRKYPVVVSVYGGPSAPTVANAFSGSIWENVLLENGYLSFKVDNRAATGISKTLENSIHLHSPGDVELNDLVDGVRWLKQQPFVDPDRIGITGWSGGGTNTLMAMTRSTEFKAGISGAGVTDFRFYDTKWGESLMETEKENREGFEKASLLKDAKNLHGKLLLIHGTHDDNVHIQNTWRFIDELIKADKLFELMVYPLRKHGVGDPIGRRHLYHTELDFWKRNL
jgi:dipeptidyl-peptidase 4